MAEKKKNRRDARSEELPEKQYDRFQMMLLPVDLAILVLALVAALTLLFLPYLKIDLGKTLDALYAFTLEDPDEEEPASPSAPADEPSSEEAAREYYEQMRAIIGDTSIGLKLIPTMRFAFNADPCTQLRTTCASALRAAEKSLSIDLTVTYFVSAGGLENVSPEVIENVDTERLYAEFSALKDATEEDKAEFIARFSAALLEELGCAEDEELAAAVQDAITQIYDAAVEYAEEFSVETCVCMLLTQLFDPEREAPYANYDEAVGAMLGLNEDHEEGFGLGNVIDGAMFGIWIFLGVMCISVLSYLVLAGMALLHAVIGNKRMMMWYAKLFGLFPALICFITPRVLPKLFPMFGWEGAVLASVKGVLSALSSFTVVSLVCYVLLWVISIFVAFPIKRKIRYYEKRMDK